MINKLSGGITYEEREGLADPMRKEVALLLPPEELEHLDILEHFGALWVFNENGGFRIWMRIRSLSEVVKL
ncbi:hypothetical protein Bca52824_019838 [Brassica carinata]|uniref:Uncharacterized protein n=1 Tax=Brassica carinata TaxID=52824 RepID=A0A8X7VSH9_BRACI|nr:hypothetical protein Bca52824_019838 [Brassica carinata]